MRASIIVPCYRSADTLTELCLRLDAALSDAQQQGLLSDWEVILVADGGAFGTAECIDRCVERWQRVRAVHLNRNFGQHNALLAGIRAAQHETIVTLDDDLQHPPEQIALLLQALTEQHLDLVYGQPQVEEHGVFRSFASTSVKRSLALAGVENAQLIGAFRAFRTYLREGFAQVNDTQVNLDVLLSWTTSRVGAVQVQMQHRETGRSSYNFARLMAHTMNMVTGYGTAPLRLVTWLGFAIGLFGLIMLLTIVLQFFLGITTVPGFTTISGLISLFAGAQMVALGIIGEYLGRQYMRSMGKPMYLLRPDTDPTAERRSAGER